MKGEERSEHYAWLIEDAPSLLDGGIAADQMLSSFLGRLPNFITLKDP